MINAILISYGCVLKQSSKPVMKGSRVESIEEARKEYKKLLEEGWEKLIDSTVFFFKKNGEQVLYLKFDIFKNELLDKLQNGRLDMKNDIFSNIKDSDALESFFECITSCSINSEGVDCSTACYVKHLEPNNIDYPLKFS